MITITMDTAGSRLWRRGRLIRLAWAGLSKRSGTELGRRSRCICLSTSTRLTQPVSLLPPPSFLLLPSSYPSLISPPLSSLTSLQTRSRPRNRHPRNRRLDDARTADDNSRAGRYQLRRGRHRRSGAGVRHQRRAHDDGGRGYPV